MEEYEPYDEEMMKKKFESMLDEFHKFNYKIISDGDVGEKRVVHLQKHTIKLTLILDRIISYDVYAYLTEGIYEIGDVHILTRKLLDVKKICQKFEAREMNTTERLYPQTRQGKYTQTSGL